MKQVHTKFYFILFTLFIPSKKLVSFKQVRDQVPENSKFSQLIRPVLREYYAYHLQNNQSCFCNLGHNSLELFNILAKLPFTVSIVVLGIQPSKHSVLVASRVAGQVKTKDLRKLGIIKKRSKLSGDRVQCPVFLPEIRLVIAVKNYAKAAINVFCSCPLLLDFFTSLQIFSPSLRVNLLRYSTSKPSKIFGRQPLKNFTLISHYH